MAAKTKILKYETTAPATTNLSVRIPVELSVRIDAVRDKAKAAKATFDVSGIVRATLVDACALAERELSNVRG